MDKNALYSDFYKRNYNRIIFDSTVITSDSGAAQLIMDGVILDSLKEQFKSRAHLHQWARTTMHNRCINYSKLVRVQRTDPVDYQDNQIVDPESEAERRIKKEYAQKLIEYLPPKCKLIIRLLFLEGYSISEVSIMLNIDESGVKTQKQRGLDIMRKKAGYSREQYLQCCTRLAEIIRSSSRSLHYTHLLYGVNTTTVKRIRDGKQKKVSVS